MRCVQKIPYLYASMSSVFDIFKAQIDLVAFASEVYDFRVNKTKSSRRQKVLEHESEIIIVSRDNEQGHHWYFNPNDPLDKGTVVDFSLWRNQGDWQAVIVELQAFSGQAPYSPEEKQTITQTSSSWKGVDTSIRPLCDRGYLHYRGITDETLNDPLFAGRIFNQTYTTPEGRTFSNTVFPLYYENEIRGLEIKNEGYTTQAPGSEKSRACWHSAISDFGFRISEFVLTESPIDALSYHQLFPPEKGRNRLYMSMSGNMAPGQRQMLESFIQTYKPLQLILALDNDEAGMIHGIKLLGQLSGEGNPEIVAEIGKTANAFHMYLTVRHAAGNTFMAEALLQLMTGYVDRYSGQPIFQLSAVPSALGTTITAVMPRKLKWLQQMEILLMQLRGLRGFVRIHRPELKDFNEDLMEG